MFSNVKNVPLAPQYRKRLLQISTVTARNIHNHASATSNDKRSPSLMGFETWDGWLIAGNTHNTFVMQNKLILPAYINFKTILLFLIFPYIFPTQQKNFLGYWRIFQIIPYPPPTLKITW